MEYIIPGVFRDKSDRVLKRYAGAYSFKNRKHAPMTKIKTAEQLVLDALDRKMPFAYRTVKPMYYLEKVRQYGNGTLYKSKVSFDKTTQCLMISNYYKLGNALKLLTHEGIVQSYTLLKEDPILRVKWYDDQPEKPLNIQLIDYSKFPDDYLKEPSKPKHSVWRRIVQNERALGNMWLSMGKHMEPTRTIPFGKLLPTYERYENMPDTAFEGEYNAGVLASRERECHELRAENSAKLKQAKELRQWVIMVMAYFSTPEQLGKEINCYA